MTRCLSSFAFMRTIDRFAELSDAKMTKSLPVIPKETAQFVSPARSRRCVGVTDLPWSS